MEIKGWNYLFENLPHWRIRDRFPYVYDQLTQSPSGEYAILIYSIAEVSMCNEVGCLAVFESREHPALILNAYKAHFSPQSPVFSANGRYVCLKSQMYLSGQNRVECPLLLLDLYDRQFTALTLDTHDHQIAIQNQTEKELVLSLTPYSNPSESEQQISIQIAELLWHPFQEINMLERWLKR